MFSTTIAQSESEIAGPATPCLRELGRRYATATAPELVAGLIRNEFAGRIALVSSFGSTAAVLLHMVARADPATPVLFLDTGKHFGETLRYRDVLIEHLGLTSLRVIKPAPAALEQHDPAGTLWLKRPDLCCYVRKVEPLRKALRSFQAYFNGRRRDQEFGRAAIQRFEVEAGRIKINPLFDWTRADVDGYFAAHGLPRHPLEEDGFLSIGCLPCTERVMPGEGARAGRWRGRGKTECGIHLPIETFKDFGSGI